MRVASNLFATTNRFRRDLMALLIVVLQLELSNLGEYSWNLKKSTLQTKKKDCMAMHLLTAA